MRKFQAALIVMLMLFSGLASAAIPARDQIVTILSATGTGAGNNYVLNSGRRVYEANIAGTSTYAATVNIEGSLSDSATTSDWSVLGTISIDQTTKTDSFTSVSPYPYIRARVTAASGTISAITVKVSILP